MAKIYILIALLPQLLYTLVQGQTSPCPQYFTYITKPGTDEKIGRIEIPSPPKISELRLKVVLKVAAELPTKYVGGLELARSKEESAQDVQQGRHLSYHVHFPLRDPIPTLSAIWFNGEQRCSGPDATGHIITIITLEHVLYLPNMLSQKSQPSPSHQNSKPTGVTLSHGIGNNIFLRQQMPPSQSFSYNNNNVFLKPTPTQPQQNPIQSQQNNDPIQSQQNNNIFLKPKTTAKPAPQNNGNTYNINNNNIFLRPPPPHSTNNNINNYNECGVSGHSGNTNLLIANGQKTLPGQWPWLAAIFVVRNGYEFQCGGSILTTKHVLTAAHCLKMSLTSNVTIHPNVLEVALGRFNLHQFREEGTVNRQVASYRIHRDYAHATTSDSDLAVLVLRLPVEFSPFIRPICLWSQSTDLQNVENRVGYVVGWGQDENGFRYTEEPRLAMMPIVSLETCHWSFPGFVSLTSNRTFCAGMQNGTGPCNGDSGSGLVLFDAITGRYQLRGVVSRSVLGSEPLCDLTQFIVFVDVAKYLVWIKQEMSYA